MPTDRVGVAERKTVLVVDDDLMVRVVVARMLKQLGYAVREAASAGAALIYLASTRRSVDLILCDIVMPGMNGIDFAIEVQRKWPELPVVLMSGHRPPDFMAMKTGLVAMAFLPKPFNAEALLRVVDVVVARAHDAPRTAS